MTHVRVVNTNTNWRERELFIAMLSRMVPRDDHIVTFRTNDFIQAVLQLVAQIQKELWLKESPKNESV